MKALRKALQRPGVACAVISLLVLSGLLVVRANGWMQRLELIWYDLLVEAYSKPDSTDSRIVLIGMTEADLQKFGYPIDDRRLAQVLLGLDQLEPCVIGLDLYRDLPEPRSGEQYPELAAAFKKVQRALAIERIGYFKGPPALAEESERIVPNNIPKDQTIDGLFRRGLVAYETPGEPVIPSLSLACVLKYLEQEKLPAEFEGNLLRLNKTLIPRLTRDAGAYVGLPPLHYEILNSYRTPQRYRVNVPRVFGTRDERSDVSHDYSFDDVLEGRVPAEAVRGKIVLVATVMESIKDSNPTPIDDNLRGVHIHAMLVHQFLEAALKGEKPMTWWPEWAEVLWIAAFTAIGGALSLWLRSPWKLAPALVGVLGALHGVAWAAFGQGWWLLLATPALGAFVTATFVTSFIAYLERAERDAMQHLFARHVSESVVDTLWASRDQILEGGRLKPQRLTCTVLFTDLKGFSTISEGMEPAALMDWMNEYMDAVARHVDLHDGVVNTYIGDAIMALFGAPVASTTEEARNRDAVNAVHCALAMRAEMVRLNEDWQRRGLPTVAMRVGIYTGELVAGSLGSANRLMFTVLGDTTNTAARLEGAGKDLEVDEYNKYCTILIGEATLERLNGQFVTRLVGPVSLKGKANQVIVHSVLHATQAPAS